MASIADKIDLQKKEFEAVTELVHTYAQLMRVPIVDDEYPEYRYAYEGAVRRIMEAFKNNGR